MSSLPGLSYFLTGIFYYPKHNTTEINFQSNQESKKPMQPSAQQNAFISFRICTISHTQTSFHAFNELYAISKNKKCVFASKPPKTPEFLSAENIKAF